MSGHIHELRIHVPWTKLGSEPVVITINTMECILKLRDGAQVSMTNTLSFIPIKGQNGAGQTFLFAIWYCFCIAYLQVINILLFEYWYIVYRTEKSITFEYHTLFLKQKTSIVSIFN